MIGGLWRMLRQIDMVEALESALAEQVRDLRAAEDVVAGLRQELEVERVKRISAEALAVERRSEADRLVEELREARATTDRVLAERLKSLDAVNIRLMEPRVEPPPPDLKQFRPPTDAVDRVGMALRNVRAIHNHVDMELVRLARSGGRPPMSTVKPGVPVIPVDDAVVVGKGD